MRAESGNKSSLPMSTSNSAALRPVTVFIAPKYHSTVPLISVENFVFVLKLYS